LQGLRLRDKNPEKHSQQQGVQDHLSIDFLELSCEMPNIVVLVFSKKRIPDL